MQPLDCPTCISFESWEAFVEVRRRKGSRAPLTDYAVKLIVKKLLEADRQGYDAQHMIDEAIESGWTTVWISARTPKRNVEVERTAQMLASQRQTPEQRAASERARNAALGAIRRVS